MDTNNIQVLFFQHIKSTLPSHVSLVDAIADVLNISVDSAYRRIRGEKAISMEEMQRLAKHYHVSIDRLFDQKANRGVYSGNLIDSRDFNFETYLEKLVADLRAIDSFNKKELIYFSKDIPLFHFFSFPELASFKFFFWMKSVVNFQSLTNVQFCLEYFLQ